MNWSDGYVVDTDYSSGFFRKQSPAHLSMACVLNGFEPVPLDRPFTYFELGCGQAFTANLLAASNPQGRFYAADFMPSHIAAAQDLAGAARLDNLTLLEHSFADLAEGRVALPPLDFITLHGVYSWVTPENRRHIVDFMARHLRPGGIVYLTYNAMPGWAAAAPLQRLVQEHADLHPGERVAQVRDCHAFINRLAGAKAEYFQANTATPSSILQKRLDSWQTEPPVYLAHEYMNRAWQALYHVDVARDLAAAKLDFVASADYSRCFVPACLPQEQRDLVAGISNPAWRETVLDYLMNTAFRGDVFVRGARRMPAPRRDEWLQQAGVALTVPRGDATLGWQADNTAARDEIFGTMLDRLADGPLPLAELAALPGRNQGLAIKLLSHLSVQDQGTPYFLCSARQDTGPAERLNRAIARLSGLHDRYQALAAPLLGSGIATGQMQRLVLHSLLQRQPNDRVDALAIAREAWTALRRQGEPIVLGDQPLGPGEEALPEILRVVKNILERRLAIWRHVRVL